MAFRFPSALYPIADGVPGGRSPLDVIEAVLGAGCRIVQLRLKQADTRTLVELARAAKALTDRYDAALIVNDRTDVAQLIGAAGVHLGQDDLPVDSARAMLGPDRIIGTSTHTLAQLDAADRAGVADYIAYGPIFATTSKERPDPVQGVEILRQVRARTTKPLVAIGGINLTNIASVLDTGVDAVAVIGAITGAVDPATATREILAALSARPPLPPP